MLDILEGFSGSLPLTEAATRLGMALLLGLCLGAEREWRHKAAGLRTHMLVSLSSALTTLVSLEIYFQLVGTAAGSDPDPIRVVQGLAQAIGFIAAGVIIQGGGRDVQNLTTATSLWMAGALGIACGAGLHAIAIITAALTLVILVIVTWIERPLFGPGRREED